MNSVLGFEAEKNYSFVRDVNLLGMSTAFAAVYAAILHQTVFSEPYSTKYGTPLAAAIETLLDLAALYTVYQHPWNTERLE
jgi:hypothetical protein